MELAWASTELATSPEAPGRARAFVAVQLGEWGLTDLLDDAVLVVSELVTNAVIHGAEGQGCCLTLTRSATGIRIAVTDSSDTAPSIPAADVRRPNGRGLTMIQRLANDWGSEARPTGKTVWAELGPATVTTGPAVPALARFEDPAVESRPVNFAPSLTTG